MIHIYRMFTSNKAEDIEILPTLCVINLIQFVLGARTLTVIIDPVAPLGYRGEKPLSQARHIRLFYSTGS